jgi:hypothetical protein
LGVDAVSGSYSSHSRFNGQKKKNLFERQANVITVTTEEAEKSVGNYLHARNGAEYNLVIEININITILDAI